MAYDFPYRGLTSNPAPLTYSMPTGMSSASSRFNTVNLFSAPPHAWAFPIEFRVIRR
jgi:hypothetical protein